MRLWSATSLSVCHGGPGSKPRGTGGDLLGLCLMPGGLEASGGVSMSRLRSKCGIVPGFWVVKGFRGFPPEIDQRKS